MAIPRTLEERLRSGKIVPFIGAGVSIAVRNKETDAPLFPSWKQLLERVAQRLEAEQKGSYALVVRGLLAIEKPDYLDAARRAREGLGGAVWVEFLKEQLDRPSERVDNENLSLARAAWRLGSQLLITTNYDRVLHWACPQPNDYRSWDIEAPAEQVGALRTGVQHPTIWYLHGRIDNATNLILTPDGYRHLYPEAGEAEHRYHAALATLRTLLASHSLLFIGFSLDDAYFGLQLRDVDEIFHGVPGPHYALVRAADQERVRTLNLPVDIVSFADFGAPLLDLMRALGDLVPRTEALEGIHTSSPTHSAPASPSVPYDPRNPVFFVPYRPKGNQVIGREASLLRVREQLTRGHRTAIGQVAAFQGLGGLGKTQLAVEYAYRYRDAYPQGVIWLNADQDLDAQLIKISDEACWIAPESEHKDKLAVAQQRLRTSSNCLIIFDNLEDPQVIAGYLPEPQAEPHILVTSRTEQLGFSPIPLDPLGEDLSLQLLLQEAGREPVGEAEWLAAQDIASALGGLPLALELAGAYLHHRPVSWQQYRELLQHNLRIALPSRFLKASFTRHEADLYSTLKIHERIFEEEPRLREILDLLTWSGPAPMGQSLLCALLDITNSTALTNALGLGLTLRLLQKTPGDERYAIHRLVREVRREDVPLTERQSWAYDICRRLGDWFQERREDFSDLANFEAEIDHLRAWHEYAVEHVPQYASRLTWLLGYPPFHRGRIHEAQEWLEKALVLSEQMERQDRELETHLSNDLGSIYSALGKYQQALRDQTKALVIRQELLGERHPNTATSLNNVGATYGELGDHHRALEYKEKALAIRQELLGERHPDTATSLNNVGATYSELGDHHRTLEYQERALAILQELFGDLHPTTALCADNVARDLTKVGRRYEAFQLLEEFLHTLPNDHRHYTRLNRHRQQLLRGGPLRPGFRQPLHVISSRRGEKRKSR
jgi:tetratricopeptide (TPR) repeat protein